VDDGGIERLGALMDAVDRLVRASGAERAVAEDAAGFLAEGGLGEADAAQLAALGGTRLLVYRRHVRRTLRRTLRLQVPRAAARLGGALDGWIDRWLAEDGPRSRYLRDAAFEMVAWAGPRWERDASVPPWLADLARHELAHFEVAAAPDAGEAPAGGGLELDRAARFHPSARIFRYAWAVHRMSEDPEARDEPAREPTALFAYRDAEDEVRWLALTPLAAAILDRLLQGATLRGAVVDGAAALGHPVDDAVTQSTAALLTDLADRGALLGAGAP
jgi:hypothetical protein